MRADGSGTAAVENREGNEAPSVAKRNGFLLLGTTSGGVCGV
jgi:hypothetical protein